MVGVVIERANGGDLARANEGCRPYKAGANKKKRTGRVKTCHKK